MCRIARQLTLTVALPPGAVMADCLDGGRCGFKLELAAMMFDVEVAAFGEGSATTCSGREGKMLRVSACTREEKSNATISEYNTGARGGGKFPNGIYMVSHSY